MNTQQIKHAANLRVWKKRIIECRASGQTVRAWCEQHDICPSTYYRWEREVMGGVKPSMPESSSAQASKQSLVPAALQTLVEIPVVAAEHSVKQETACSSPFCPVAVLRLGTMELSLTNAVAPELMKLLKELLSHAE